MEIVKSLFCVDHQTGWINALSVPSHAVQFPDFEKEYLWHVEEFLAKHPIPDIELQKLPQDSIQYFQQLVFSSTLSNAIVGMHVTVKCKHENIVETIQKRLEMENNTYQFKLLVWKHCRCWNRSSSKVLYDFVQTPCVQDSSKLLQKAFSCLQDMQQVGQPYIVLAAHSKIPIIQVMAESFLHLSKP